MTDFLANIDSTQINNVKIYDKDGNVLYDCGTEYDVEAYVGTGAKVELILGGEAIDTVYLSVLGDTDGDGEITTKDSAVINAYIANSDDIPQFELAEYMLSALLVNNGDVTTRDAGLVGSYVAGDISIEDYYFVEND